MRVSRAAVGPSDTVHDRDGDGGGFVPLRQAQSIRVENSWSTCPVNENAGTGVQADSEFSVGRRRPAPPHSFSSW